MSYRASRRWIPATDAGVAITLRLMRRLVREAARDPLTRRAATRIVGAGAPVDRVLRLRSWLARHVRFEPDPPGVELLRTPALMLEEIRARGETEGDCDDVATLAAALGRASGFPARFVVAAFSPRGPWEHVWTDLRARGRWWELDTTRPEQLAPGRRPVRTGTVEVA